MAWAKVDDKLHTSVKWRRASKAARGLWATALSWCSDQENDGHVPADMLRTLDGTRAEAGSLVKAGLWDATDDGWVFHDWQDYNPDGASKKAKREAESQGGKQGAHVRWHEKKKIRVPTCEWCYPDNPPNGVPHGGGQWGANAPVPDPTRTPTPNPLSHTGDTSVAREDEPPQLETSVPRHVLPPGWAPGNTHKAYAGERGIDLGHELRQFRLHCKSKRITSLDWDAEFEKWLGNARIPGAGGSAKGGTSDRVHAHADLARRLAAEESNVIDFPQLTEGGS